jgi:hypothetical protein
MVGKHIGGVIVFGGGLAFYSGSDIVAAASRSAAIVLRERKTPARKAGVKSRCMSVTPYSGRALRQSQPSNRTARAEIHKQKVPGQLTKGHR